MKVVTNTCRDKKAHHFRTVPDQYAEKLINEGIITEESVDKIKKQHTKWLGEHLRSVDTYKPEVSKHLVRKITACQAVSKF